MTQPMIFQPAETPLVIMAEGCFGDIQTKLSQGVIRYGAWPVAAVLDSTKMGKTVRDVTGLPCDAPIVADLQAALKFQPRALLIGTAPAGGKLPPEWRAVITEAIRNGLHIINGLHFFLSDDSDWVTLARQHGVRLWDVRDPLAYGQDKFKALNEQKPRPANVRVVTMVGTDCAVGKMHSALELFAQTRRRGHSTGFLATGQTGILISGRGVPLDRVIGDFMAGAMEVCLHEEIDWLERENPGAQHTVFVEGQGSLMHPAYSGVTLSLVHGSNPDAMILCHKAGLETIRNYPALKIPETMRTFIAMYETAASWVCAAHEPKAKVVGLSVNTSAVPEEQARDYLKHLSEETGLPVTDPVRYGVDGLLDALDLPAGAPASPKAGGA